MSLPDSSRNNENYLELVFVFKHIKELAKQEKLAPQIVGDEFITLFPQRADFQLARLTNIYPDLGLQFSLDMPNDEQNIYKIILAAANAIEQGHDCKNDVLRVIAAAGFKTFELLGYVKRGNQWRSLVIRDAVEKLFLAMKGRQITRPQNIETNIFNQVLLPSVQILMDELLYKRFEPSLTHVGMLIKNIRRSLRMFTAHNSHLINFDRTNHLFKLENIIELAPWAGIEPDKTTTLLIQKAQYVVRLILSNFVKDVEGNEHLIPAIVKNASWIQIVCWVSSRQVRTNLLNLTNQPRKKITAWRESELKSLASLSRIERMRGRFTIASQYANLTNLYGFELYPPSRDIIQHDGMRSQTKVKGFLKGALIFAQEQGMIWPPQWILNDGDFDTPYLAIPTMRIFQSFIDSAIQKTCNNHLLDRPPSKAYGYPAIQNLLYSGEPVKVAHGFILAYRLGFLKTAAEVFAHETNRCNRDEVGLLLTKTDFFGFVKAVANVTQHSILFCNHSIVSNFKAAIRKIWNRLPESEESKLNFEELLFLHHTQIGMSYYAVLNHKDPNLAHRKAFRRDIEKISYADFDNFAEQFLYGSTQALTTNTIRQSIFTLEETSVFVSFVNFDGDKLKVLVKESNGRYEIFTHTASRDWNKILDEYRIYASEKVRMDVRAGQPYPWVEPDAEILSFFNRIVFTALNLNPNARRLVMHCDQMWNIVPWQYLMRTSMKNQLEEKFEDLRQKKLRVDDHLDFSGLLIWRINGVLPYQPCTKPTYKVSEIVADESDAACSQAGNKCRTMLEGIDYPKGHISIIAHGDQKIFTNLRMFGEPVSSGELTQNCSGFDLVILHVCSAADVIGTAMTGDTGGLPALFITNGAKLVIAPTLPIPFALIDKSEPHFQKIDQGKGFEDVEKHYSKAIQEDQTVAMYTLFSDELVAPRLVKKITISKTTCD